MSYARIVMVLVVGIALALAVIIGTSVQRIEKARQYDGAVLSETLGQTNVAREAMLGALASVMQSRLAVQHTHAAANTSIAVSLLGFNAAIVGAVITAGRIIPNLSDRWGWSLAGFGFAGALLVFVLVRKGWQPSSAEFDDYTRTSTPLELQEALVRTQSRAHRVNAMILKVEELGGIYPSMASTALSIVVAAVLFKT